jgi:hypothetical protein
MVVESSDNSLFLKRNLCLRHPGPAGRESARAQSRTDLRIEPLGGARGVRYRGPAGRFGNAEVHQAAETAGKTAADLAEGIGASELAKEHGYELRPAGKSLGGVLSAVFLNQSGELGTGKMLEQLIEQAGSLYDCLGTPCGRRSAKLPARKDSPTFNYRRALYPRF